MTQQDAQILISFLIAIERFIPFIVEWTVYTFKFLLYSKCIFSIHKISSHIKGHFMYIHNFSLNQSKEDYVISFLDIDQ